MSRRETSGVAERGPADAPPDVVPADPAAARRPAQQPGVSQAVARFGRFGLVGVLALMLVVFSLALPDTFLTAGNFRVMVNSQAILLLLAMAALVPLRAGDFDLSVAGVMGVSGAVVAQLDLAGVPLAACVLAALAVGLVVGLLHALLIVRLGLNAFVTTLGTLTALGGAAYGVADNGILTGFSDTLRSATTTTVGGLYLSTLYGWALVLLVYFVFELTPAGRQLLFVGGNRTAARLSGVPVARVRSGAFVASSCISALAGVVLVGVVGSFDPSSVSQYLLPPFAAAFLGAATIYIGRFNAVGTMVGLYLLIVGVTGLELFGAPSWVSAVFNGSALILAIAVARALDPEKRVE